MRKTRQLVRAERVQCECGTGAALVPAVCSSIIHTHARTQLVETSNVDVNTKWE